MTTGRALDRRLGLSRLTARSVIASTLLGASPPELPTRSLVATAELLGIAPGTARVAMSRMVASGELEATGAGYRLVSPTLLARQARQTRSRAGSTTRWDGDWRMLVVTAEARPQAERSELRTTMAVQRFAELREGVWLRPDNLGPAAVGGTDRPPANARGQRGPHAASGSLTGDHGTTSDGATHGLVAMTTRPDDPVGLAASLWDLRTWADRAKVLLGEVDRLGPSLAAGDAGALAEGFVVSATILRHFQADPLLPPELWPADWPGRDLRQRYDGYDAAFRRTLVAWQRQHHPSGLG